MKRRVACFTSSGGPQSTSARTRQPCPTLWAPACAAPLPCSALGPAGLQGPGPVPTQPVPGKDFPEVSFAPSLRPPPSAQAGPALPVGTGRRPASRPDPCPLTCLAPASRVPCLAAAGEICAQVLAGTPIHTRAPEAGGGGCKGTGSRRPSPWPPRRPLGCTEASGLLTQLASRPSMVGAIAALETCPLACRPRLTYLTVPPGEAWGTVTLVFADVVEAGATVVTGARGARVWLPWKEKAPVGQGRRSCTHHPCSLPVLGILEPGALWGCSDEQLHGESRGLHLALAPDSPRADPGWAGAVRTDLAVPPGEGVGAGAVVLAARLLARAAVLARP